jgi:hypothetical protein
VARAAMGARRGERFQRRFQIALLIESTFGARSLCWFRRVG